MKVILLLSFTLILIKQGCSNSLDSCVGRCGYGTDLKFTCQCDSICELYGDCCHDYKSSCAESLDSCQGRCGQQPDQDLTCQCDSACERYGDCCHDYKSLCKDSLDSCLGRCGYGTDPEYTCQCNSPCERYGDCCHDYESFCKESRNSCKGRCDHGTDSSYSCQCNTACERYSDCCHDYESYCKDGSDSGSISDAEIKALSEVLYSLDSNKPSASELIIDSQALIPNSQTSSQTDRSPFPLFAFVDEASLFSKPTYASFLALLDNYERKTGQTESFSAQQLEEQETFLRESISNTELGRELYAFLQRKGLYKSEKDFLYDLKMMWFGLYSRYGGKMDSSGFEHIFAGEIKGGKVSGFHNWLQFYKLEKEGLLEYYSHSFDGPWTSYPDVLGMQFKWDGYFKQVGSAIIGCSPEFDLAVYSLCYITRPGKRCYLSLDGKTLSIQTYTWDKTSYGNGKKYIGSAFPATP